MRRRRKRIWIILALLLTGVTAWLLWPLSDASWRIRPDEPLQRSKTEFLSHPAGADTSRPNIIIILADDLGKSDLSLYGGLKVQTPNIDAIGRDGVTFTDGYVTAPICAPSRASLLTGRYSQRFGFELQPQKRYPRNRLEYFVFRHILDTDNWTVADGFSFPQQRDINAQGLPPSEITLAELLRHEGYATGITGKWHLGHTEGHKPNQLGFDYQYGFYEAFTLYADPKDEQIVNARLDEFTDKHIWKQGREKTCAIRRNDTIIEEKEYLTFAIAREASAFIRRHREHPFFLYIPFSAPHTPYQAPKSYYDALVQEPDHNRRVYYAMIKALDDAVGQVMEELRRQGLERRTVVYFASDNGAATYMHVAESEGLKGGKFSNFEGGINVPYMVQWKGTIPPGSIYHQPVTLCDVFTTSAMLAGSTLPADRTYDGVNLLRCLSDSSMVPHEALFWRAEYNKAVRSGPWKLIIDDQHHVVRLYRLDDDQREHHDLHETNPLKVEELRHLLQEWEKGLKSPLWPRIMDYKMIIDGEAYYFAV